MWLRHTEGFDCDLQDGGGKVEINPEGKEYMLVAYYTYKSLWWRLAETRPFVSLSQ